MISDRKKAHKKEAYRQLKKDLGIFTNPFICLFIVSLPLLYLLKYLGVALVFIGEKLENII